MPSLFVSLCFFENCQFADGLGELNSSNSLLQTAAPGFKQNFLAVLLRFENT